MSNDFSRDSHARLNKGVDTNDNGIMSVGSPLRRTDETLDVRVATGRLREKKLPLQRSEEVDDLTR